jgi:hypothetical protein
MVQSSCFLDKEGGEASRWWMWHGGWEIWDEECGVGDVEWAMWDGGYGVGDMGWRIWSGRCGMEDVEWAMWDGRWEMGEGMEHTKKMHFT